MNIHLDFVTVVLLGCAIVITLAVGQIAWGWL